ncbi:methyltransferase [Phytohabitans suffuscus]|uniref:Methyltransferase n=1 Tax=Phytohabitans suffuscus TaxID=624315 RepID=A0A6F8Y9P2_9ACTN|nr:methyltransferase [Phytohabitans suffuscus]
MRVVNTDQAEAWNGPEGAHWADHHDRAGGVNSVLLEELFRVAAIGRRDVVLDIGCGTGDSTRLAARRAVQGRAVGIDLSSPMLERARAAAAREGVPNARFDQGDAQVYAFPQGGYDVAISMFGVMFFGDPVAAFANIGRALRPGGRLVFACPGEMSLCDWYTVPMAALGGLVSRDGTGAPQPSGMFSLADRARTAAVLTDAGFGGVSLERVDAELEFGANVAEAVEFFFDSGPVRAFAQDHPEIAPSRVRETLVAALRPYEHGTGVRLNGAHWIAAATRG